MCPTSSPLARPLLLASIVSAATGLSAAPAAPQISTADREFFETRVRPVLVDNCYKCHSREADKPKGGLLLDTRENLLEGGNSGDAIVPGDPEASLLIRAIGYLDEDLQMPPRKGGGKKLSDQQIADLTEWVRRGAPDPRERVTLVAGSNSGHSYGGVGRNHWAFQPAQNPPEPKVSDTAWPAGAIDRFVLARLEAAGLSPSETADRPTMIRRVSFDLTGLPPTEKEVGDFVADNSPQAFARVVDRLLASPAYGEHWARYWLDLARYSDTKGDAPRRDDPRFPHAWTYRDYVIDAFNRDKPYDQFIIEQLAADRLLPSGGAKPSSKSTAKDQSALAALGFLTVGEQHDGRRNDIINDQIDVTTKAFLGLTVACARCHDHKFDPIPTKDYYSLYGVFASTAVPETLPTVHAVARTSELEDYLAKRDAFKKRGDELRQQFIAMRRSRERDPQKRRELLRATTQLSRQATDLEITHPGSPARAMAVVDIPRPRDFPVLVRGEPGNEGEVVPRRFLEVLSGPDRAKFKDGSGRLELARAIADPKNPLAARVLVNRVWQQLLGAGFVFTPDDLGNMSAPPTHPELLDHLATSLVREGWSVKRLVRQIVLSRTYQQSSLGNPRFAEIDPENRLLWRANLRRLDVEQLHDALLAMAGTLDLSRVGGKSVPIASAEFTTRRAVYTYIDRRNTAELLTQFDFPNPGVPTGRRYETIVPQQALFLMNSPLVIETARKVAHRPEIVGLAGDEDRVRAIYLAVFQRPPSGAELKLSLAYVRANPEGTSMETPTPGNFSAANTRAARQRERQAEMMARNPMGRRAMQPEPGAAAFASRDPLDAWSKLAHALLQTNEAFFLN